jgi:predicted RND superfamily exporter protein
LADAEASQSPVIANIADFDRSSGSIVERVLFNNRPVILVLCLVVTIVLGFEALQTRLSANFTDMIPTHQSLIVNYFKHYDQLQSQGNAIHIAVEANQGTIINSHYLEQLKEINDQVYLLPGVNRPFLTSLWTSNERWRAVTPDGIDSEPVITNRYDGSPAQLQVVKQNIALTGQVGELVSSDLRSSMIFVPLLQSNYESGSAINYGQLSRQLNQIRDQYATRGVTLHIIGFAMVVGDMINGIDKILAFFAVSVVIAAAFLFWYTRCVRSTLLVVSASLIAVIWQMGLLTLLGYDLTPYSVLVPFLVFAIGMSHGAQKMNGVTQDIERGTHPLVAARYTFRRLFLAGFAALVCDAASFLVLMTIGIDAIRQLAVIASIGVALLVFTNLIMLPILLSYTGVSIKAARRSLAKQEMTGLNSRRNHPVWNFLDLFTRAPFAQSAIAAALMLAVVGVYVGRNVQVGDTDQGAPELRQHSQYNRDNSYIISHYATGSDTFVVMTDTPAQGCLDYDTVRTLGNLEWQLNQLPPVQSTLSVASASMLLSMLLTEDAPKWYGIEPNQSMLDSFVKMVPDGLTNITCSFSPLYVNLKDHKAATLTQVVNVTQKFIADPANQSPKFTISIAGGNAGIEAATNIVIKNASREMLLLVYATVIVFCFIAFRSWRAVVCAILPLVLTSILAQALMVWFNIGVKVATLPVSALGVGIGVDYALYVLSIVLKQLRDGASLSDAYHRTLLFTGKVVLLTGFTLATGVITWVFAPIKFQADMGLLLAFMFLWNMLGAMILLPSLAYFLLPPRLFARS